MSHNSTSKSGLRCLRGRTLGMSLGILVLVAGSLAILLPTAVEQNMEKNLEEVSTRVDELAEAIKPSIPPSGHFHDDGRAALVEQYLLDFLRISEAERIFVMTYRLQDQDPGSFDIALHAGNRPEIAPEEVRSIEAHLINGETISSVVGDIEDPDAFVRSISLIRQSVDDPEVYSLIGVDLPLEFLATESAKTRRTLFWITGLILLSGAVFYLLFCFRNTEKLPLKQLEVVFILYAGSCISVGIGFYLGQREANNELRIAREDLYDEGSAVFGDMEDGLEDQLTFLNATVREAKMKPGTFTRIADSIVGASPFQWLAWITAVPDEDRSSYESALKARVPNTPGIWEYDTKGGVARKGVERSTAETRPTYFPVTEIAPTPPDGRLFGFDTGSESNRKEAIERALELKESIATKPLRLAADVSEEEAIVIFDPVFSPEENHLMGFVVAGVALNNFMENAISGTSVQRWATSAALYEFEPEKGNVIKITHLGEGDQPAERSLEDLREVEDSRTCSSVVGFLFGKTYVLIFSMKETRCILSNLHWGALSIGMLLTFSLALAMYQFVRSRTVLEMRVANRTRELAETKDLLERTNRVAQVGGWVFDRKGRFLRVTKQAARILGIAEKESLHLREVTGLFRSGKDRLRLTRAMRRAMEKGEEFSIEIRLDCTDSFRWVRVAGEASAQQDRIEHIYGSIEDITQERLMRDKLRDEHDRAELANRAKSEFLANMSHELRTPMNGVIGMGSLLSETQMDPDQREMVETICESGEALLALLNDILDFAKIESGKTELDLKKFSPRRTVGLVQALFRPTVGKKKIGLRIEIEDSVPEEIYGDQGRLRQIIINLVGNAVKFTHKGEVVFRLWSEEATDDNLLRLVGEVRDTGIGISEEDQKKIFEPFTQADATSTRKYGGTGLGLSICKRIVRLMGGDLQMESALGAGSTFRFSALFYRTGTSAEEEIKSVEEDLPARPSRILIAEDNPANQMVLEKMLEREGHSFETVRNGLLAMEKLSAIPFDLVLMDVRMPRMDGLEAARKIRDGEAGEANRSIPIIAITANALPEEREECLEAGMNDMLAKPISMKTLHSAIQRILGN